MVSVVDIDALRRQLGRKVVEEDEATAAPLRGMAVTFEREEKPPARGEPVPPGWRLTYFPAAATVACCSGDRRARGPLRRGRSNNPAKPNSL